MATASKRAKPAGGANGHVRQAVGAAEAAALMGVHWSIPQKLAVRGKLSTHVPTESAYSDSPSRSYAIYDGAEADADYRAYDAALAARGGKSERRPRAWVHLRPAVLRHLKAVEQPIAFDDAISLAEAGRILGVDTTFVPRLVAAGKVVGRVPWSSRVASSKVWIISRKSCLANARDTRRLEAEGRKLGRPRRPRKMS